MFKEGIRNKGKGKKGAKASFSKKTEYNSDKVIGALDPHTEYKVSGEGEVGT